MTKQFVFLTGNAEHECKFPEKPHLCLLEAICKDAAQKGTQKVGVILRFMQDCIHDADPSWLKKGFTIPFLYSVCVNGQEIKLRTMTGSEFEEFEQGGKFGYVAYL